MDLLSPGIGFRRSSFQLEGGRKLLGGRLVFVEGSWRLVLLSRKIWRSLLDRFSCWRV